MTADYVGWTCGKCGGPVAGPYAVCEICRYHPRYAGAHDQKAAEVITLPTRRVMLLALRNACDVAVDTALFAATDHRSSQRHIYEQTRNRLMAEWCRENGEPEIAKLFQPDPRDPDPSREGVFRAHNCYRCRDGKLPCIKGNPRDCDTLRARND